jgi:ferrous iron transport protein B
MGSFCVFIIHLALHACVATLGAIVKEHGAYWAGFSMLWSFSVAYVLAVGLFQTVTWAQHPTATPNPFFNVDRRVIYLANRVNDVVI